MRPTARGSTSRARPKLKSVPDFQPAYLIHGEDHGRVAERRAKLAALAQLQGGAGGIEQFDAASCDPATIGRALSAMTFAVGWRFLIISGCERWRDADVSDDLAPAMAVMPQETTIAFFASEDGRQQAPESLHKAVKALGGTIASEGLLKAKELPPWAISQAASLSITLDGAGAQALIAQVGERQQRLLRELEKLALEYGPGAKIGVEEVSDSAANSSALLVWALVDAIVARDQRTALITYLRLRDQNEDAGRLAVAIVRRLRDVTAIAERLDAGVSESQAAAGIAGGSYAAKRRMAEARGADPQLLREATEALAALELASRGGSALDPDTETLRVIERIAA